MTKPFSLEEIRRAEEARKAPHVLDDDLRCPDCKRVTPHRFEFVQVQPELDDPDAPLYAVTSHTCRTCKQTHATHVDRSRVYPEEDLLRILSRRSAF
jgi:hypothetical protein